MSLIDRTNETIALSQHKPLTTESGDGIWPAELSVDVDQDSAFDPPSWVDISLTDSEHDSDRIKLTFDEAGLLHDRLGLILHRPEVATKPAIDAVRKALDCHADEMPVRVYQEVAPLLDDIPDCESWTAVPHAEHELEAKISAIDAGFQQLHWGCNNPDHGEGYNAIAKALGYSGVKVA